MKEGLSMSHRRGYNAIVPEGDLLEIIKACTDNETWWSESSAIYAHCVDLATSIGNVKFKFYRRKANKTSHELARNSFLSRSSCIWKDGSLVLF
jgi:hypothetical protein